MQIAVSDSSRLPNQVTDQLGLHGTVAESCKATTPRGSRSRLQACNDALLPFCGRVANLKQD